MPSCSLQTPYTSTRSSSSTALSRSCTTSSRCTRPTTSSRSLPGRAGQSWCRGTTPTCSSGMEETTRRPTGSRCRSHEHRDEHRATSREGRMHSRLTARKTAVGAALIAIVALAVALSASAGTKHANGNTILIGSIAGTTGAYGSTGVAMVNGAKLAVADLNARGGALGKKFTLQSYNDQASATLSSQLFQRLVSAGAVAVAGSGDTGPATSAMAQRLHIPNIGAVDDAGITIYPKGPSKPPFEWVWSWGLNTFAWGGIAAHYAMSSCKGLAVLHDPSTYGGGGDAAIKLAYKGSGKKIVLDDSISEDWSTGA